MEEITMKRTRKAPLWYNPTEKDTRRVLLRENDLVHMAADREGQSLLESYCRLYRKKL